MLACSDGGPWACAAGGCPAPLMNCQMLSKACWALFEQIWTVLPDATLAKRRIADECRATCGSCVRSDPDCRALVPAPVDTAPIRSPQQLHTALLPRLTDKSVVEIGTRNGDGMACFSQVARTAVAIELDKHYCTKLVARAAKLSRTVRKSFNVSCQDYRSGPIPDGDLYTWWQQPPNLKNNHVLRVLRQRQLEGQIRSSAEVAIVFDRSYRADMGSYRSYMRKRWLHWSEDVQVDENSLCYNRTKSQKLSATPVHLCRRARGTYTIAGMNLQNVSLEGL